MELKYRLWSLKETPEGAKIHPIYDAVGWFVVYATTEAMARQLASEECGDEGKDFWLDSRLSSCEPFVYDDGRPGVVFRDFHAG